MLIEQLGHIARAERGADQIVGAETRKRFEDLVKEREKARRRHESAGTAVNARERSGTHEN
jgi:hypothetical protein